MILAYLVDHVRMRPRKLGPSVFKDIPTVCKRRSWEFRREDVILPFGAEEAYQKKRDELFGSLGKKDPDTVPNALEVFAGKWKKPEAGDDREHVARNQRYKGEHISTFAMHRKAEECRLIDLPLRQRDFNDWLKLSGCRKLTFLHTGLPVDNYFFDRYQAWFEEVKRFAEDPDIH